MTTLPALLAFLGVMLVSLVTATVAVLADD